MALDTEHLDGQFDQWVMNGMPLDSRIMIAPVIGEPDIIGRELEITGFVAFYVDDWDNLSKTLDVRFTSLPEGAMVPEPGSLLALLAGLGGLGAMLRRSKKAVIGE